MVCLQSIDITGQERNTILDQISSGFLKYCENYPWEEVYVHTDREEYIAGENIWLEAYLLDRQTGKTNSADKIVYVEVLNRDNRPVIQSRFWLEKGSGPGQLVLSDTLSSGTYTLRAYTNWMKNFLPGNSFMKKINIYNALNTSEFRKTTINAEVSKIDYKSSLNQLESGFDIRIDNSDPDNPGLKIITDNNFRTYNAGLCYLFIQTHGVINYTKVVALPSDSVTVSLSRKMLVPGINQITIFNSIGKPVAESFIYTSSPDPEPLSISSVDSFGVRDKISIELDFGNQTDSSLKSSGYSISVAPVSEHQNADITNYMVFGSEFGYVPDEIRNTELSKIPDQILTNYLATVRSNWINWTNILSGKYPAIEDEVEKEYHSLHGRLVNKSTRIADTGRYVLLSSPGKNAVFEYARTNTQGDFVFNLPVNEDLKDLIIQPEDVERNDYVVIKSSFSDKYPRTRLVAGDGTGIPSDISKLSVNYQVLRIYGTNVSVPAVTKPPVRASYKRFYGKPDIELIMDDYIKLPVMEEVFFELTPGVFLKKRKGKYEVTIADPVDNRIYEQHPVLFVDGVVVHEPAVIANLDPEVVEKIDAVKGLYVVGDYVFYGLVNVITRSGDYSHITQPEYAVRLPYRVIEPVNSFSSPDYPSADKRKNRIPDFRNTLYWNPSVKPDKGGKTTVSFWSSDYASDYQVTISGITSDGKILSAEKVIRVR